MIYQATYTLPGKWVTDGNTNGAIMRIPNTGDANKDYQVSNPLGREPVEVLLIKKNMACDVICKSSNVNKIVFQFTLSNADVTVRVR